MEYELSTRGFCKETIDLTKEWLNAFKTRPEKILPLGEFLKSFGHQRECEDGSINCSITSLTGGKWYIDDDSWLLLSVVLMKSLQSGCKPSLQEVIRDGDYIHPFFDLETKEENSEITDATISHLAKLYSHMYERIYVIVNPDKNKCKFLILRNEKDIKRRVHVYFPEYVVEKRVHKYIVSQIKTDYPEYSFIDECMNGLRLPYMYKKDDYQSVYLPRKTINDLFILDFVNYRIKTFSWEKIPKLNSNYQNYFNQINNKSVKLDEIDDETLEKISKLDRNSGIDLNCFKIERKDGHIHLNRIRSSYCCICDRNHESDNMTIYSWGGNVYLRCFRGLGSKKLFKTRELSQEEKDEKKKAYIQNILSQQDLFLPPSYVVVNEYNSRYTQPFDPSHTIELINSSMDTGKTTQLLKLLKDNLKSHSSIIFLCSKRSYADFITRLVKTNLPEIKFVSYLDDKIENEKYICLQAESINRIQIQYDVVVMDEITSFLKQMDSGLHRHNLRDNREKLEHLIRNAKQIIAMDGDMPMKNCEFLHKIRPNDIIHLQRNLFRPSNRKVIWFNSKQKRYCMELMYEKIRNGENVCIVLGSASEGKQISQYLKDNGIVHAFYHNEDQLNGYITDGSTLVDLWKIYQVVMYTSTITVGLDFNNNHFDCQFVYGNSVTNNVREIKQMMGRIRQLNNKEIYVCNTVRNDNYPITYDQVRTDFIQKAELNSEIARKNLTPEERELHLIDGKYVYSIKETIWTWLSFHNKVEDNLSKNYYNELFRKMLEDQGYKIKDFTEEDEVIRDLIDSDPNMTEEQISDRKSQKDKEYFCQKRILNKTVKENELSMIEDAPILTSIKFKEEKQKVERGIANICTVKTVQKNAILQHIPIEARENISAKEIINIEKFKNQLYQAEIEVNSSVREQLFQDINSRTNNPLFGKYQLILYLCSILGVTKTLDRETEIPCSLLKANHRQLLDLFDKFKILNELRTVKPKDFNSLKRFVDSVLYSWSGTKLKSFKVKDRKIKWSLYQTELIKKYNVSSIENVPQFEWINWIKSDGEEIIRVKNYIYKLKPPSEYFDSHFELRLSKIKQETLCYSDLF